MKTRASFSRIIGLLLLSGCIGTGSHLNRVRTANECDAREELCTTLGYILSATSVVVSVLGEVDRLEHKTTLTGPSLTNLQTLLRSRQFDYSAEDTMYISKNYAIGGLDIVTISTSRTVFMIIIAGRLLVLPSDNSFRLVPFEDEISTALREMLPDEDAMMTTPK